MATPESLVNRGIEGTGAAQIFSGNPLRGYFNIQAAKAKNEAVKQAQAAKAKEARDKRLIEMFDRQPDKFYQPFNEEVLGAVKQHRGRLMELASRGVDVTSPEVTVFNSTGWDRINNIAAASNAIKEAVDQEMKIIDADPYLKGSRRKYLSMIMDAAGIDENGRATRSAEEVNVDDIHNVFYQDPSGYDLGKFMKDYVNNLESNVFKYVEQKALANGMGDQIDTIKTKIKGQLFTPDPNDPMRIKRDSSGNPIVNITPDFVSSVMSNELAKTAIEFEANQKGTSVEEVLRSYVSPQGALEVDADTRISRDPRWMYERQFGGIDPNDEPIISSFFDGAREMVNAFVGQAGEKTDSPSLKSREFLGNFVTNVKAANSDVLDATLVPGTNEPGSKTVMGISIPNSANDRLIFKTKTTRGPKPVEINLNDPGAVAAMYNIYTTGNAGAPLKKYGFDKLAKRLGVDPSSFYSGDLTAENERLKALENDMVDNKWMQGLGGDQLAGKLYEGKKIKDAKFKVKPTGFLGLGSGEKVWDVQFEDGTYGEIPADRETLAGIYRGGSNAETTQPKPKRTTISKSEIPERAKQAGYTVEEYEKLLREKGIEIK